MSKSIYDLELHETLIVNSKIHREDGDSDNSHQLTVTRVSGGWIYRKNANDVTGVFVPYTTEFKKTKPNDPRAIHNLLNK